jgi:hypothetical protein
MRFQVSYVKFGSRLQMVYGNGAVPPLLNSFTVVICERKSRYCSLRTRWRRLPRPTAYLVIDWYRIDGSSSVHQGGVGTDSATILLTIESSLESLA